MNLWHLCLGAHLLGASLSFGSAWAPKKQAQSTLVHLQALIYAAWHMAGHPAYHAGHSISWDTDKTSAGTSAWSAAGRATGGATERTPEPNSAVRAAERAATAAAGNRMVQVAWRTTVDTAQSTGWRAVWEARHAAVARASDRSTLADAGHEVARASWLSVLEQRAHLIKNMDQHLETIPMTDPNKVPWKDLLEDLRAVMRTPRFQQAFPEVQALFHQTVDMIATLTSKTPHQTRPGSDDGAPSFEDLLNHMEQSLRRSDRAAKERITWRARECTNEAQEAVSSGPTPTQRACVIL